MLIHFDPLENRLLLDATLANGLLHVVGSAGDDVITVSLGVNDPGRIRVGINSNVQRYNLAAVKQLQIDGLLGNDRVTIRNSGGIFPLGALINGGAGDDTLIGGNKDDTLSGGVGNDIIHGGDGADVIRGGDGNDVLKGDHGSDSLFGDNGRDVLIGAAGRDVLNGGGEVDILSGGSGNDILTGGAGLDSLKGGDGVDQFRLVDSKSEILDLHTGRYGDILQMKPAQ